MLFRRLSIYVFIIVSLFGALGCHEGGEEGLPPEVTLEGGRIFRTELGSDVTIAPSFAHLTDNAVIRWMLDEQWVGFKEHKYVPRPDGISNAITTFDKDNYVLVTYGQPIKF